MLLEKEAIPKKIGFVSGSKVEYTKEKRRYFSFLTKGCYEPVQPKNANTKFKNKQDKVNNADSAFIFLIIQSQRSEKMALSGLVFARKIARMILIQNMMGP